MVSSSQIPGLVVVIFGSAARRVLENDFDVEPRDIDVIYRYDGPDLDTYAYAEAYARDAVKLWAHVHGLGDREIDLHRDASGDLALPSPFGVFGSCIVLRGDATPKWREYTGLASAIRAFGWDVAKLREVLTAGQPNHPLCREGEWEISLDPKNDHAQWDESYCNGVEAIRSAMRHAKPGVWEEATKDLPWARLVEALLARGVDVNGLALARRHSSGGGARIIVRRNGDVVTQYGGLVRTLEQALDCFAVPPPVLLNTTIVTGLPDAGEATYSIRKISPERVREVIAGGFVSAIGHDATARAMSAVLFVDVPVNRVANEQRVGQSAVALKIRGRLPEGAILDDAGLAEIGFDLYLMKRLS